MKLIQALTLIMCLLSEIQAANHAIILQYHHVSKSTPPITSITPELFSWHLEYLEQQHYTIWPLSKIAQYIKQGKQLPDKCVAITFDDAYRSVYSTAFPLLKKKSWPFTLFLNTDAVGKNRNTLNWDEIREMNDSVAEIGNHSHSHAHLIRYKNNETEKQWHQRIINEINTAQSLINTNLSSSPTKPPLLFAYPYGEYSVALAQIITELGYTAVGQHSGPVALWTPQSILPRFPMGGPYTGKEQLIEKLKTYPLPLNSIKIIEPQQVSNPPILHLNIPLEVMNKNFKKQFKCYVSGQAEANIKWQENTGIIQAKKTLHPGRNRYNCTAPTTLISNGKKQHGFYWYSQLWIKRKGNGQWYQE
ncbi:MAG: polysaccharide deacetylase family protein [Gammaproteobacteria bacterium]|nr:polysaccharide deacetylase family protein [Gammaproteobacteria bacterium]